MQAITALAHLHSTVLYFLDISEQCGYSLEKQVALFHSIKPLFQNKPLLIVANKTDLRRLDQLEASERALIDGMLANRPDTKIMPMSNMTEEGVTTVLHAGCDMLLAHRIEKKLASTAKMENLSNRLVVTQPVARDNKERPASIPPSVLAARERNARLIAEQGGAAAAAGAGPAAAAAASGDRRKTERDLELEHGGPGIYNIDLRKNYLLANPDWKYDIIPEFMDGKNIADFVDPDIERRLAELEAEETVLQAEHEARNEIRAEGDSDLEEEQVEAVESIRRNRKLIIQKRLINKTNNKPVLPRAQRRKSLDAAAENLEGMGLDADKMVERARSRSVKRLAGQKRARSASRGGDDGDDGEGGMEDVATSAESDPAAAKRAASLARVRSRSRDHKMPRISEPSPFRNVAQKVEAEKRNKKMQKGFQQKASRGESDRKVLDMKPKHLFSGKTGFDRDRR
jgi:nucleolar GTP-binding protein